MAIAGVVLVGLTGLALLVFGIQILVRAFKTSIVWGLVSLFVPLAVFVFVIKHWAETRKPFLLSLACIPVQLVGFGLMLAGGIATTTIRLPVHADRPPAVEAPSSAPRVETATLVLETVTAATRSLDLSALPPCVDASIGATAIAPKEVRICGRHTDFFGETKLDWKTLSLSDTAFGEPLEGQWITWLRIMKKQGKEQVAFLVFTVQTAQKGAG
jgi:hypothetical protein